MAAGSPADEKRAVFVENRRAWRGVQRQVENVKQALPVRMQTARARAIVTQPEVMELLRTAILPVDRELALSRCHPGDGFGRSRRDIGRHCLRLINSIIVLMPSPAEQERTNRSLPEQICRGKLRATVADHNSRNKSCVPAVPSSLAHVCGCWARCRPLPRVSLPEAGS